VLGRSYFFIEYRHQREFYLLGGQFSFISTGKDGEGVRCGCSLSRTYSKSIDQSSSLAEPVYPFTTDAAGRAIDPTLSRAISTFDMRHNFVASYRYELPLNRLFNRHERLTRGWAISGITRFSTGFPVTLFNNRDTSLLGTIPNGINNNGVDTPSYRPGRLGVDTNPRNERPEFNTALFGLPQLVYIGTRV
jgi:hypothetical protein